VKVHFEQKERQSPELGESQKRALQWSSHPKMPLHPVSSSPPVKPSASSVPTRIPRIESSITEKDSLESSSAIKSTSFAVRSTNPSTTKESTMADTAVEADHAYALPSHDLKDSKPQIHDGSESNDHEKFTKEDSVVGSSATGNFQTPLDHGQPHEPSNLATGPSNGTGAHSQEQSAEVQPSSSKQTRGLKQFFHRLCCFPNHS
jgi:hypothetical protein